MDDICTCARKGEEGYPLEKIKTACIREGFFAQRAYTRPKVDKLHHCINAKLAKNRPEFLLAGGPKTYFDGNQ